MPKNSLTIRLKFLLVVLACFFLGGKVYAQEVVGPSKDSPADGNQTAVVWIVAKPKSVLPFEWKYGDKVTLGVRMISPKKVTIAGIGTDMLLAMAKVRDNRVEMLLRTTVEEKKKILAAAKMSEFWFEVMPFKEEHKQIFKNDVNFAEFLKANPEYRPADEHDWIIGGPNGMEAPSKSELEFLQR